MTMDEFKEGSILLVDGSRGIYQGQVLAQQYGDMFIPASVSPDDIDDLLAGPGNEYYLDAWASVVDNGQLLIDGALHYLTGDGDIWAVPY